MATLPKALVTYQAMKHLVEPYVPTAKYPYKEFVRSELLRVTLEVISKYPAFPPQVIAPLIHLAIKRRIACFGMVERLFKKHSAIPRQYVGKLGGHEKLGWERSDVLSELNIKMLMTIRAWGRRYREFQHTGRYKPVPLDIFIRTAMNNRLKDFFKYVERQPRMTQVTYATEGGSRFDIISHQTEMGETVVDLPGKRLVICGEDVLQGLGTNREKAMFMLNFMGFKPHELDRKFARPGFLPSQIVTQHQERLLQNTGLRQLLSSRIQEVVY